MNKFEELGIDEDFNPFYAEQGIKAPNEVQNKVIPKMMNNQSVICIAQTGSGKTLSFALPISELIKQIEDEDGLSNTKADPYAVIIAPTKELAQQIHQVFKSISHHVKLRVRSLVSKTKVPISDQCFEVLISTPTKLARAIKKKEIRYNRVKYLVFDEADNLFDMGFRKDIETALFPINYADTDIHFFSATMPAEVEDFLNEKFKKKKLERVIFDKAHQVQSRVDTYNIFLQDTEKNPMLKVFLTKTAKGRGIIFCNQKNQVKDVENYFNEQKVKMKYKSIHGDLSQVDRLAAIKSFQDKKSQVLIATDVVARGIDIADIEWVLNYNLPKTPIYYIHRSGRTARAGRDGIVYNFVTKYDSKIIAQINESIRKQTDIVMELIKEKPERKKAVKKVAKKKVKTKRVKITKRTKRS